MEGQTDNIKKICMTIKDKDPTFEYSIMKPQVEYLKCKFESLMIINSSTEEEANKRGGWFIYKCKNAKVAGYFWVKSKNPEN